MARTRLSRIENYSTFDIAAFVISLPSLRRVQVSIRRIVAHSRDKISMKKILKVNLYTIVLGNGVLKFEECDFVAIAINHQQAFQLYKHSF